MSDSTIITTTRTIYPQIYAYVIPEYKPNEGWIKIGYTERKSVDERIRQQTHTAGIAYSILWSEPAKFALSDEWFVDKQLHAYLRKFKHIDQRPNTEWFYYDGKPEKAYSDFDEFRRKELSQIGKELEYHLRAEQEAAVQMTLDYAAANTGGEFLWNAKPRFGKTLTTYDLIRRLGAQKVLIVTNRPAIANSWFDDFETFIAWQTNYRFISTSDTLKERPVLTREQFLSENLGKPDTEQAGCIAFVSLQDLKGAISFGGYYEKLEWVKNLTWDLLVIDEAHEGVDTFKTDVAFNNITRDFTIHLSGTPFKAVASGKFSQTQIFNWTYADEQDAKAVWSEDSEENNPYESLPRLNLFSYQISQMITDEVNKGANIDGMNIDFAFDLNEFFATDDKGKFIHETEVRKWLDTLTRNEKHPFSTPELRAELKHTFWLLNRVASAKALEKLLRSHPVFEHYEVILAAGDGRTDEDDPAAALKSFDRVRSAIKNHDKTITLSVGQLTTGVTVPEWTAVMMLSNLKSPSLYMQAAFRAQNPWSYDVGGEKYCKQNAYIFDFAPERTLIIYDEFANNLNGKTISGGGTTNDREENIRKLLNFFPVIAEDDEGKMIELDVMQILTIPKTIKAQEVVKRGFMSNLLFQNISGIFTSTEAREILEQLNPVAPGKVIPTQQSSAIDTKNVEVDGEGNAVVDPIVVVAITDARFGEKVYASVTQTASEAANDDSSRLTNAVVAAFTNGAMDTVKDLARENYVTQAQAELVVKQNANALAREVEIIKKQADIKENEATIELNKEMTETANNPAAIADVKARYEAKKQEIARELQEELKDMVTEKVKELTQKSTETILQKAEEKKKYAVEDDIRARLRGFARTIPSFLMAYGTVDTALANFDTTITDSVFKEVTGITLDQFRALRDVYNFFDEVVFNESVREFMHKKAELANYFDDNQTEDIFDYVPPQRTNQIFTPRKVVKMMINKLEEENTDLFTDKDNTFADLYVKSGLYLTEIVKRLFSGLENAIPDKEMRLKHILENQIYGFAPSEIIYNIARSFVFGGFANIDDSHLQCLDLTEIAKNGGTIGMKFDAVVGNPPYQEEAVGTSTKDLPIYSSFYDLAKSVASVYTLISPARFLFNAGGTNKKWNQGMLNDEHLRVLFYEQKSENIFPNTDIKGGVAVLYRNSNQNFGAIGTFTSFEELNSIILKVANLTERTLAEIVANRGQYRYSDKIYDDYPAEMMRISDRRIASNAVYNLPDLFTDEKPDDGNEYIQIYARVDNDRGYRWFKRDYLSEPNTFEKYKVILPKANGSGAIGEVLSTPLIGEPLIGVTETFITIGAFDDETEAENCLKYIKSKFARTMLGVLKVTQDNPREKWARVPLQDFTLQSDIDWTQSIPNIDRQLYIKYGLDDKEITFIEEKVKAMDRNIQQEDE